MSEFDPQFHVLPAPQRRLWPELREVPKNFVLYGGTAVALWLGHRTSLDFDFFSDTPFTPDNLLRQIPFLMGGNVLQASPNTLTLVLEREGSVKVSFFGGLTFGRVGEPVQASSIGLAVASKLDLAATKARVVVERAESKDYLDMAALLKSGIPLAEALGGARALFGDLFNPMISIKALTYFGDGDLGRLPSDVKQFLTARAGEVTSIPPVPRLSVRLNAEP